VPAEPGQMTFGCWTKDFSTSGLRDPGESGEPFSPAREVGARHAQFAGLQAATNQGCVRAGGEEPDVPAATRSSLATLAASGT
jgi:hypothetical protein